MNNPVMYTDGTGEIAISLTLITIGIGVGFIIGSVSSIVSQYIEYGWDDISWGQVMWDGLMGGIMGGLSMSPLVLQH